MPKDYYLSMPCELSTAKTELPAEYSSADLWHFIIVYICVYQNVDIENMVLSIAFSVDSSYGQSITGFPKNISE